MDENFVKIKSGNLNRYLVSRNYWYVYRNRIDDFYYCFYRSSKLLDELLEIYNNMSKEERNTYVVKDKQKAE